ncbi:hypothetical protein MFIFM68171_04539 [Madurella fahalii]|uniref:Uncharacterized protein n=1 Tax=Madurella fahalii TaxID=1157608 RepID=A0ABQ0G9D9_9PEZI
MDLTASDFVHFGGFILSGVIPIVRFLLINPTLWVFGLLFAIITTVLHIVWFPFSVGFYIAALPLRSIISIVHELEPVILWMSNAVIIGATAGGFITLLTVGLMNTIDYYFPQPPSPPLRSATAPGRPRLKDSDASAAGSDDEWDISSSSEELKSRVDPGTRLGRRWGKARAPPIASTSTGRRRTPAGVLVEDTIHEEESSSE